MKPQQLNSRSVKDLSNLLAKEYYAQRAYRYMSNCLRNSGYKLAAAYYAKEAEDEFKHAICLEEFATDWNVELSFLPQEGIDLEKETIPDFIEFAYKLESNLLKDYKSGYMSAFEEGDLEVALFMQKMVKIQTQAVVEVSEQLNVLELFDKSDKNWLLHFEAKVFG